MHTGTNFATFAPSIIFCFTCCILFQDFSGLESRFKTFYQIYHSLHNNSNGRKIVQPEENGREENDATGKKKLYWMKMFYVEK